MGLLINTNVASLNAQKNLALNKHAADRNFTRLSSGYRINSAGDDAAGLVMSEILRAQIKGFGQTKRNAEDGTSMVQIAEGGLNEVSNILIRLRELAIQAASDTVADQERVYINQEFQSLLSEIDRLAKATEFNGIRLLDGSSGRMEVQIGLKNDPAVDRLSFDGDKIDIRVASIGVGGTDVAHKGSAQESLGKIDTAINRVAGVRADLGAFVNRMESIINTFAVNVENLSAANSRIRDADIAAEAADLTKNNILLQAGSSVLTQANAFPKTVLNIIGATSVQ